LDEEKEVKKKRKLYHKPYFDVFILANPGLFIPDMSFGSSPVPIRAINSFDCEPLPQFKWINKCIVGKGVPLPNLNLLVGCKCCKCTPFFNCICVGHNKGLNGYDSKGCIKNSDFPIYECNAKCQCSLDCKNRIVQKGIQFSLEIFKTKNRGWGVKALEPIPRGSFVSEYVGEIIRTEEANRRDSGYLYDLDHEVADCNYVIDAAKHRNVSGFLNHSCRPNLVNVQVFIDNMNNELPSICFFAQRNIKLGEELTIDYKVAKITKRLRCYCGEKNCRKYFM